MDVLSSGSFATESLTKANWLGLPGPVPAESSLEIQHCYGNGTCKMTYSAQLHFSRTGPSGEELRWNICRVSDESDKQNLQTPLVKAETTATN